jgi:hypothetical protein
MGWSGTFANDGDEAVAWPVGDVLGAGRADIIQLWGSESTGLGMSVFSPQANGCQRS